MNHYLLFTTYPVLFFAVFANQLAMPVPGILFLLAAGALCHTGQLSFTVVIGLAVVACLSGDAAWFWIGRRHGRAVLRLLSAFSSDPTQQIRKTKQSFDRYGLRCLLFAKFIPGIDMVAPPLAGIGGNKFSSFIVYDAVGSAIWAATYAGAGQLFSRELSSIAAAISRFGGLLSAVLGIPLGLYMIWHTLKFIPVSRNLHRHPIRPEELRQMLKDGDRVLVLDLLNYEEGTSGMEGIPNSVRVDPGKLHAASDVTFPSDLDVVLYCATPDHFRSSRVAMDLRKHGLRRIQVLAGGLNAWRAMGYPLTHQFLSAEDAASKYNIHINLPQTAQ